MEDGGGGEIGVGVGVLGGKGIDSGREEQRAHRANYKGRGVSFGIPLGSAAAAGDCGPR